MRQLKARHNLHMNVAIAYGENGVLSNVNNLLFAMMRYNCLEMEMRQLKARQNLHMNVAIAYGEKSRAKQREHPSLRNDALQLFRDEDVSALGRWDYGEMDTICGFCNAKMWIKERSTKSNNHPQFFLCCENGKVLLPNLPATPQELEVLLTSKESNAVKFRDQIRMYNSVLAFTSLGAKVVKSVTRGPGPYSFRIQGELYHKIGSLCPAKGQRPQFAQLYIHDTKCRNPTLAKCGGEAQHSQSWGLGVLRDSRMFRVRQQGPKLLALRRS
jgi:hypothetical protein